MNGYNSILELNYGLEMNLINLSQSFIFRVKSNFAGLWSLSISFNCIISSMHSLLSAERFLKDFKMPGWAPLTESIVKKQIELSEKASKKSVNDLKFCAEMIEKGCKNCRDKETALYQVIQQCIAMRL